MSIADLLVAGYVHRKHEKFNSVLDRLRFNLNYPVTESDYFAMVENIVTPNRQSNWDAWLATMSHDMQEWIESMGLTTYSVFVCPEQCFYIHRKDILDFPRLILKNLDGIKVACSFDLLKDSISHIPVCNLPDLTYDEFLAMVYG